ncbi:MAG TPA: ABC transporter permease [Gemmata sp.]|nr:ABC transporter permease [Gemmata sp.]
MRLRELTSFALGGLWRQKIRTGLTLVGVMVGTCALAFSLALGFGLRAFIDQEFKGREDFWRIVVTLSEPTPGPNEVPADKSTVAGSMSDERRERLREALIDRYVAKQNKKGALELTPDRLRAIASLPDVEEVRTFRAGDGRISTAGTVRPASAFTVAGPLADLRPRLLAGRLPEAGAKEIILSELALYDLGFRDDADLDAILGQEVVLSVGGVRNAPPMAVALALLGRLPVDELSLAQMAILERLARELPDRLDAFDLTSTERAELKRLLEAKHDPDNERPMDSGTTVSDTYRVCGVVRINTRAERKKRTPLEAWELFNGHAFLAPAVGEELFGKLPWVKNAAVNSADIRVRPGGDLPGTVAAIDAMGFRTLSAAKWFKSAQREVTLIAAGLNLFAMMALLVAAIGITNTLVTSVVERTKEIGILRAVGATRAQVQGMFLAEGAFIGLLGSVLGLALARGLSVPADTWVHGVLKKQVEEDQLLSSTVFAFPWWLWVGSVAFAALVTTAAAYYPARRAARIHPIEALRYG